MEKPIKNFFYRKIFSHGKNLLKNFKIKIFPWEKIFIGFLKISGLRSLSPLTLANGHAYA
jgi:hypothetical protein